MDHGNSCLQEKMSNICKCKGMHVINSLTVRRDSWCSLPFSSGLNLNSFAAFSSQAKRKIRENVKLFDKTLAVGITHNQPRSRQAYKTNFSMLFYVWPQLQHGSLLQTTREPPRVPSNHWADEAEKWWWRSILTISQKHVGLAWRITQKINTCLTIPRHIPLQQN